MGPLMLDCVAYEVSDVEKDVLAHPAVGGVILFSRNYHDIDQVTHLITSIRQAAKKPILIAIDHEGGRVQRFRQDFTAIPAMGAIQTLTNNAAEQQRLAYSAAITLAYELKRIDVDMTFAPVLDLDAGSDVIGDRAFGTSADEIVPLASAFCDGLRVLGMPSVGKHFPGHGSVKADSHVALPVDTRPFDVIENTDMQVFTRLMHAQKIDAVMPSHVIYADVDDAPAGFSEIWLQRILKQQLAFNGAIFSDDLSMHGASVVGGYAERAERALAAGCDMILACNNPTGAIEILDSLPSHVYSIPALSTLTSMTGKMLSETPSKMPSKMKRSDMNQAFSLASLQGAYEQARQLVESYARET